MNRTILSICFLLTVTLANSQTSVKTASATIENADYYLQKALLEKQNGRRMESLEDLETALKYDASHKTVIAELAVAYLGIYRKGQAIEMYQKLESLGDHSAANYKQLMTLSNDLKQKDDVLLYAAKLKKADPTEKISYYTGRIHYENENYGVAIKLLLEAEKEDPSNTEIPYMLAQSYVAMDNYKMGIPYFRKAIELKPKDSYRVYELGFIFYSLNDFKNAVKYMQEAGEKGLKRSNDYLENLGLAYLFNGDFELGAKTIEEVLVKKPSNKVLLNTIAEAYYMKNKFQEAMDYWNKVLEYDNTDAFALYMSGMCYQKKGGEANIAKGMKLCDKAIEMDPNLAPLRQKKMVGGL